MSEENDTDAFKFVALGGGSEVGRSCHIIQYKGKTIMLDAGVHPAFSGLSTLPFYDEFDLSTIDILLISHFHLDHAASLPYVMQHTNFKGRVFMTHPTKAIYRWLLTDFVKVTSIGSSTSLYTDEDLLESFDKIETVDYHSTMEVDGIRFTAYHAGHVLGAAMYLIEIGGLKVFFTGDYSREESRHLNPAEVPPVKPDVLITESTFGTATHEPRLEKELRLTNLIHSTLVKGGRVLLPVFALGTAQELLLILDEYWNNHPELENINVYYASSLAKKCLAVFQTYINMMNDNIRKQFRDQSSNPFQFKHVKNIKNLDRFEDFSPCVVVASPGMLQNGVSRELLEKWAPDSRNSLILTGYSVEGTLAKNIIMEPDTIPSISNPDAQIPRRLNIEEISFAAHVDYEQNSKFIELVDPRSIILVHGESNPMGRLKSALLSKYSKFKNTDKEVKVYNPRNCDELSLKFKSLKVAKALGFNIEEEETEEKESDEVITTEKDELEKSLKKQSSKIINGVLIAKDFDLNLMKVDDVREYAGLTSTIVKERQTLRVDAGRDLIQWHLSQMFGYVEVLIDDAEEYEVRIMNEITINFVNPICTVEWTSGIINDTIADSVVAILMSVDSSPASVKLSSKGHNHSHGEEYADTLADSRVTTRINRISKMLKAQFGESFKVDDDKRGAVVKIGKNEATINYFDLTVECSSNVLKGRIENVLNRATELVAPLAQSIKL
jgi:cleavage and polyadenylation specificity factor subunit 3